MNDLAKTASGDATESVDAGPASPTTSTSRKIIAFVGMQRSGNHAVLDWLGSLFASHTLFANNMHDLFSDVGSLSQLLADNQDHCLIFSFEDSGPKGDLGAGLLKSVAPFPTDHFPGIDLHTLMIVRDPYNLWASRLALHERRRAARIPGFAQGPSWERFRRDWLAIANQHREHPASVILFNRWVEDREYRKQICASLGGTYSEATLDDVPKAGGGSSFDGLPRPSYSSLARDWRRYLSPTRRRRLLQRPLYYVQRLLRPRMVGRRMKVDQRWKSIMDHPSAHLLFADRELRAECRRMFPELVEEIPFMHDTGDR